MPHAIALLSLALVPALLAGQEVRVDELLVVERTVPGRRSPIVIDALEARLARGTFEDPLEGRTVERSEGEPLVWRRIAPAENGRFTDGALRGGWGFARVELDRARVLLIEPRGCRRVYVNGVPRAGDIYDAGNLRFPAQLEAGTNRLLFRGGRGSVHPIFSAPPASVYIETRDRVLPDVVRGEEQPWRLGIRVGNATTSWRENLRLVARFAQGRGEVDLPPLSPLSVRQIGLALAFDQPPRPQEESIAVTLELIGDGTLLHTDSFELRVRAAHEKHRRTFVSEIDGSVQYYAVTPPLEETAEAPALFLTLHGASVEATGQAGSYSPKDWGVVVAPTNRRPFGFDWEDWGRLDALEVLADAGSRWNPDPRRIYLTGHSMGGHGTWNLGAHFPGTFAAIAPSAGWRDFWSYGTEAIAEPDPVERLLEEAANASRTLLLEENYAHHGVFVLHGDADDNVPVTQARFMRERLAGFHTNFAYYEEPGAGHWWGRPRGSCVDWPPLFRFLRDNLLPEPQDVRRVAFVTVNPAINATCHWVEIHTQERSMEPSRVSVELKTEERTLLATTENVRRLSFDLGQLAEPGADVLLEIDGQALATPWPEEGVLTVAKDGDAWTAGAARAPEHKSSLRAGPFKEAFRHRMIFVFGTQSGERRSAQLYERARLDAEVFGYRGNGSVDIVPDTRFDARDSARRNVILYGNADDNALWKPLLGDSPIQVREGFVQVGERTIEGGDLVALFVRPNAASPLNSVAAIAPTGDVGLRASVALPYFVSGVGYPDWTVVGAEMFERGSDGIRAAGYFGPDWSLESGRDAWR